MDSHSGAEHYVKIWLYLVFLLAISIIGPMLGIKIITLLTAFGIAFVKAYLVIKHFMHLNLEKRYITYMLGSMLTLMLLLFAGIAPDIMKPEGLQWKKVIGVTKKLNKVEEEINAH